MSLKHCFTPLFYILEANVLHDIFIIQGPGNVYMNSKIMTGANTTAVRLYTKYIKTDGKCVEIQMITTDRNSSAEIKLKVRGEDYMERPLNATKYRVSEIDTTGTRDEMIRSHIFLPDATVYADKQWSKKHKIYNDMRYSECVEKCISPSLLLSTHLLSSIFSVGFE